MEIASEKIQRLELEICKVRWGDGSGSEGLLYKHEDRRLDSQQLQKSSLLSQASVVPVVGYSDSQESAGQPF